MRIQKICTSGKFKWCSYPKNVIVQQYGPTGAAKKSNKPGNRRPCDSPSALASHLESSEIEADIDAIYIY